jgi:hypothetical protein
MKKQVISKDEIGLNIVILSNEAYGFSVKGISRCHADDTYDKDLGIRIANTRAWIKYYDKLSKFLESSINDVTELKELLDSFITADLAEKAHADSKLEELKAEYAEIVDTI